MDSVSMVSVDGGGFARTRGTFGWAVFLSLVLHAALFLWLPSLGSGAIGVPNGSPQVEVFSLNYMGTWQEDEGEAGAKRGTQTLIAESAEPVSEARQAPKTVAAPAAVAKVPPAKARMTATQPNVLTSRKGTFTVPVEPKEKAPATPVQPSVTENQPHEARNTADDAPTAPAVLAAAAVKVAEGQGGLVTGGGSGVGPPPAGESLLVAGILPAYPKNAANEGAEGVVVLQIHASKDGKISKVQLGKSSGDKRLDDVAVRTVSRLWQVKPYEQPYVLSVTMEFSGGSKVRMRLGSVEVQDAPEA